MGRPRLRGGGERFSRLRFTGRVSGWGAANRGAFFGCPHCQIEGASNASLQLASVSSDRRAQRGCWSKSGRVIRTCTQYDIDPSPTSGTYSVAGRPNLQASSTNCCPTASWPRIPHGAAQDCGSSRAEVASGSQPQIRRASPQPSMLNWTAGLSWTVHLRAAAGLVRFEPERRRSGVGPGRDAGNGAGRCPE
jgi:hypothetical protein